MQIYSFSPFGYEGSLVTVEVDLRRGIPAVDMVGLADSAVKESRERMRSAIINSGYDFPLERVLISLSPADLKKEGAGFDLPLAISVLQAKRENDSRGEEALDFKARENDSVLIMGELELSGIIRSVKGVHAAAATACQAGITRCIVPEANAAEAREVSGMTVYGAQTLEEAWTALNRPDLFTISSGSETGYIPEGTVSIDGVLFPPETPEADFSDIRGQKKLIRGLQIAAAGGHNILAFGPPGCGKTLALQRFGELLPLLTLEEAQSSTRIHSLAGLLHHNEPLMRKAPFRMPHQTASVEGMCGGGVNCRPGEISLAHNGALFLDEAAEFRSTVLQMLRVPVENGSITLCRAGRSTVYPAKFQLLLATNPCPCGQFGSEGKLCLCSAKSVDNYWKKFSGPLLDRIEIRIKVNVNGDEDNKNYTISTSELRKEIATAIKIQRQRQGKKNSTLTPQEILEYCKLTAEEKVFLDLTEQNQELSKRGISGILKVARTISDMKGTEQISMEDLKEAVSLRGEANPFAVID